jgi:hypothetical protein
MVTSGAAPLIVYAFRRVRRRTSTDAFQTCDAGRAGVHLPSEAGTPDMTIGRAAADRAGARPSCAGGRAPRSFFGTLLGQGWAQTLLILAPLATDPDVELKKWVAQEIHGS